MSQAAVRLFNEQLAQASGTGVLDVDRLRTLVVDAYNDAENERGRTDHAAVLMAAELEKTNARLEQTVESLQAQNMRFEIALEAMQNGLALYDRDQRLVVHNTRMHEMMGGSGARPQLGWTLAQVVAASTMGEEGVDEAIRIFQTRADAQFHHTVGGRDLHMVLKPTADGGYLAGCEDVTERNRATSRIAFMAYHDLLTELPNRALLRDRLDQALRRGDCAVLCLDLDGFKLVNDTLGHAVGDGLLRAVTGRLRKLVREGETLARLGGDEFAVVVLGDLHAAAAVAKRMVRAIAQEFEIEGNRLNTGTSIGIAVAPQDGTTGEDLMRHADMALYAAKADGRGCYRNFEPSMGSAVRSRQAIEQELRHAIDDGQLEVYYQPQVRLADRRVFAFEALLRWHHPERGSIPPAVFIPVAEEGKLIERIGDWVLRQACTQATLWPAPIGVSVNVSAVQLHGYNLYHSVANTLQATGLFPGRLEIEVTETAMLKDWKAALQVLHRLRSIGVRVAIDDFGAGYSSINHLQAFPFDRIKIDRSFIGIMQTDSKAAAVVRSIAGLARTLHIAVTAEGVETQSQLSRLSEGQCEDVQGFVYSEAVPAGQTAALLDRLGSVSLAATAGPLTAPSVPFAVPRARTLENAGPVLT